MFGVLIPGPASILCDNQGVVKNASLPDFTLSKQHNAINYNVMCESATAGIICRGKDDRQTSLADAFTEVLPHHKCYNLFSHIGYSSMFHDSTSSIEHDPPDHVSPSKCVKLVT